MRSLVRTITRRGKAGVTRQERKASGEFLAIGRATNQDVLLTDLRVALNHAEIHLTQGGGWLARSRALAGFEHNGRVVQSAALAVGDRLGFGNMEVRILALEPGYDLVVEVEQVSSAKEQDADTAQRFKHTAQTGWLNRRAWSWGLFVLVFGLFFGLPLAGFWVPELQNTLRSLPGVPSDHAWISGPMHRAHQFYGQNCNVCHEKPFVQVEDAACVKCHAQTAQHVDPTFFDLPTFTQTACQSCHKEHQGDTGVIRTDEAICTDCHRDLKTLVPDSKLHDVRHFGSDHPPFKLTLTGFRDGKDVVQRVEMRPGQPIQEASNLIFDHKVHLKRDGIKGPEGKVQLACATCHQPEPGGAGMLPIRMETMCQNCHRLDFESDDPQNQVPHGKAEVVLGYLEAYYARRALEGGYPDATAPEVVRTRRRPGTPLNPEQQREILAWSRQQAREMAGEIFQFRGCNTCHQVQQVSQDPPQWDVLPARVNAHWFRKARFTHLKHETMACGDCHEAQDSAKSTDVLIPGIDNCRQCHGDDGDSTRIASACVDCHGFHMAEQFRMGPVAPAKQVP